MAKAVPNAMDLILFKTSAVFMAFLFIRVLDTEPNYKIINIVIFNAACNLFLFNGQKNLISGQ